MDYGLTVENELSSRERLPRVSDPPSSLLHFDREGLNLSPFDDKFYKNLFLA